MAELPPPAVIELARQPDFALGPLTVKPSTLEIVRGPDREVLEPRVMQVLVALHQAAPNVVPRDDLIAQCWEGRVVGDDAINRAIGRLRRIAETDNGFAIETVPRVGYRLTASTIAEKPAIASNESAPPQGGLHRRTMLVGAGVGVASAAAAIAWFHVPGPAPAPTDPALAARLARAWQAWRGNRAPERAQAISLYQALTVEAPNSADAWGGLAASYASASHNDNPARIESLTLRAHAALERSLALDPNNVLGWYAKAILQPPHGQWVEKEKIIRQGLALHPGDFALTNLLAHLLSEVGRGREAADLSEAADKAKPSPDIDNAWFRIQALWGAGRIPEADQAITQGEIDFPRNVSIWFSKLYVLIYTGRAPEAAALVADVDGRPPGVPDDEFDTDAIVVQAFVSNAKADIDKAAAAALAMAARGGGLADNAMQFLSAMGRVDDAFAVADGLYRNRGIAIPLTRYSRIQGDYATPDTRRLWPLFLPSTRAMRQDARFAPLVADIGLTNYWQKAGIKPDYQRYPEPA